MSAFANIAPAPLTDGVLYAASVALPVAEADLGVPVPVTYYRSLTAVVELSSQGLYASETSYVILQTDLGDGVWLDLCWCGSANLPAVFFMDASVQNANAIIQQSRVAGTAPTPLPGSNAISLGARIRFVGQGTLSKSSSSSASSGTPAAAVLATIRYKFAGLR